MSVHLLAMGGGGFLTEGFASPLDQYALRLTGKERPRVLLIPTAGGDSQQEIDAFYSAFRPVPCRTEHLSLFRRSDEPLDLILDRADLLYVTGGSSVNLLALWRAHDLHSAIAERARNRDLVIAGVSAGALCWFSGGVTISYGPALAPLTDGLRWLPDSFSPHYNGANNRRAVFTSAVHRGLLPEGYGVDDNAALHFRDERLQRVVAEKEGARAYRVRHSPAALAVEEPLPVMLLRDDRTVIDLTGVRESVA